MLLSRGKPNAGFHIAVRLLDEPRHHYRVTALHVESGRSAITYCREHYIGDMVHELMRELRDDDPVT